MQPTRPFKITALCAALALGALSCSSSGGAPGPTGSGGTGQSGAQIVEIFSWWIAPGEAEALQALLDLNKAQHPSDRVFNAAANSEDDARVKLAERLAAHDPPDLFQQNAHELPAFLQNNPGSLQPLDDFFASQQGLAAGVHPDVLRNVTVNGKIYAMPVNIHRENSLFYNKQIFADQGLTPPSTLSEFLDVCRALKAAGITPVATAYQGWILRIMFNVVAMGSMGAPAFNDFMAGGPRDDAALKTAIDVFTDVLDNYTNADAGDANFGWTNAAEAVFDGKAAMFLHGDWAKGYYVQLGWTPGIDFGVVGAPGASELFWYGVDTFSMPVGALHPAGTNDFLQTIGSISGQIAFNRLKGSTPVRADVPRAQLDSEGRATLDDFENATYRVPVLNWEAWHTAMQDFAITRDKAALFQAYVDNPPVP
jgi:glucose/mannose transport system substrate-binding protein